MSSERAKLRQLMRDIEAAVRVRFGKHIAFKVYCDTSDGDENEFTTCIHHAREPAGGKSWIMFPRNDEVVTRKTKHDALHGLLESLKKV